MSNSNRPQKNASWKIVGVLLAHQRKRALLAQQRLAELAYCDTESIASVEQGRRPLSVKLAVALDAALEAKGIPREAAEAIPRRERCPAFAREYIEHEEEALSLLTYENAAIPGLLQTPEYAAAVFANLYPPLPAERAGPDRRPGRLVRVPGRPRFPLTPHAPASEADLHSTHWPGGRVDQPEALHRT